MINPPHQSAVRLTAVSLRLGHAAGLTVHRTVIQHRVAASLPIGRAKYGETGDFVDMFADANSIFLPDGKIDIFPLSRQFDIRLTA